MFTGNVFMPVSVITAIMKCVRFIQFCRQNYGEKMGLSLILSVIHTITIGTMLNFNGGNPGHGLKTLRVNRPLYCEFQ